MINHLPPQIRAISLALSLAVAKADGKERYTWKEDKGIWKKVEAGK